LERILTKKKTGINTTKKRIKHVKTEAIEGLSFFEKSLKTGLNIPVATMPNIIEAKKGAISLPSRTSAIQKRTRKKKKTDL